MKKNIKSEFSSFVENVELILIEKYRQVIAKNNPDTAKLLTQKFELQGELSAKESHRVKAQRMKDYISFWDHLSEEEQYRLACEDAKINYLARMIRTMGTTAVVQTHNAIKATTAGSFDFVLRRFREEGVTAAQLQRYIDENAIAWFSLTGHPTNPTTVPYTKAQIALARVIADNEAGPTDLDKALQGYYEAPIVGPRKTPLDEAEEILATMNVIYDSALPHKRYFERFLEKHGYAQEGVKITKPLIIPCAWTLGDGDGNENLTAEVLRDGIALHREKIKIRYLGKLRNIENVHGQSGKTKAIADAINKGRSKEEVVTLAEVLAEEIGGPAKQELYDFAYLVKCFGLGFGTIDIRHNAIEILDTVQRLGDIAGLGEFDALQSLTHGEMEKKLTSWLEDEEALSELSALSAEQIAATKDKAAARIFGRLKVIGENPDMCEKLIIAETTHAVHALASLLLLKITGNQVANENSKIDIVLLSESVKDLMALGSTLEDLLENRFFRAHVASRKRLLVMIAKSDTTRQDGRGEAEFIQYETAVEIYRVADKMRRQYPELGTIATSVKNGGGHALQRGGGRVTEIPALHGKAAAEARVTDIGPSTLTIQGEQLTILFCAGRVAYGTLEAFVAQNLYTKAGVRGEMPVPPFSRHKNKQYAQADAWLYAKTAGQEFDLFTKDSKAIDNLLTHAPWLAMKAGNASSRPAKRGEKPVEPGVTPFEAKGEDPKALQGRAISGERLTAHSCLPVFAVLGLKEAMEAVRDFGQARANPKKYGDALHHLYRAHKIHRDGARVTVNAVTMADFDIAWPLLTGRIRPRLKEIVQLARQFDPSQEMSAEVTIAYLEKYFIDVERLTYEMISGQEAPKNFRLGDALRKLWPDLAEQVMARDRAAEFARVIECYRTRQFDKHGDVPLSELQFRITQALYASANVVNAPVGILATRTRLEPVEQFREGKKTRFMRPESYREEEIKDLLKIPSALR